MAMYYGGLGALNYPYSFDYTSPVLVHPGDENVVRAQLNRFTAIMEQNSNNGITWNARNQQGGFVVRVTGYSKQRFNSASFQTLITKRLLSTGFALLLPGSGPAQTTSSGGIPAGRSFTFETVVTSRSNFAFTDDGGRTVVKSKFESSGKFGNVQVEYNSPYIFAGLEHPLKVQAVTRVAFNSAEAVRDACIGLIGASGFTGTPSKAQIFIVEVNPTNSAPNNQSSTPGVNPPSELSAFDTLKKWWSDATDSFGTTGIVVGGLAVIAVIVASKD